MSGHTPGPWTVRPLELFHGGEGVEVVATDGETICDNQTYYPHAIEPKNARLIAAAPDLLVACRLLYDCVATTTAAPDAQDFAAMDAAVAAIAKAEGK